MGINIFGQCRRVCMYSAVKKSSCIERLLSLSVFYESQLKASGLPPTDLIEFDRRVIRLGVGSAMLTALQWHDDVW
jgi:hypothetical protein